MEDGQQETSVPSALWITAERLREVERGWIEGGDGGNTGKKVTRDIDIKNER
jgi:hypothetical protein